MEKTQMRSKIQQVEDVKLSVLESYPKQLVISATGIVPTGGWTEPALIPYTHIRPPENGIYDFDFVAKPPEGPAAQVVTSIEVSLTIKNLPDDLKGVRVHSAERSMTATLAALKASTKNHIGTWLVLGPVLYKGTPDVVEIITDENIEKQIKPIEITDITKETPKIGKITHYGEENYAYTWKHRNFLGMDWNNIHDIEDNIHQHLPGDFSSDPFATDNPANFSGKHHALAFFLIYIKYEPAPGEPDTLATKLFVRSDDAIRVWLNGFELDEPVKFIGERNINAFTEESSTRINLNSGYNILLAAVAQDQYEWGFSARIEDDAYLRYTTQPI